jgi:formate dehydrogenase subunit gamma
MTTVLARIRIVVVALALVLVAGFALPAAAQRVDPNADSVKEEQLLQELNRVQGRGSIPDTKSYVIEQPGGRDWRVFRTVALRWIGGIAILGMLALLVLFYLMRGTVRIENGRSGRTLLRFNVLERLVHWVTATSFVVLALTGLNITFGRPLLLPLIGPEAFTAWSQWAKYAHNYISFAFTLGVAVMVLMWLPGNFPTKADVEWFKQGGGMVGHSHPPAYRFNAGQKLLFWFIALAGATIAITGYLLMFPFYVTDILGMQFAQVFHSIIGVLFIALIIAHAYLGTIGMEGAFEAMGTGTVDVNWAAQHHKLWLEQEQAKGHAPPAGGKMQPAE